MDNAIICPHIGPSGGHALILSRRVFRNKEFTGHWLARCPMSYSLQGLYTLFSVIICKEKQEAQWKSLVLSYGRIVTASTYAVNFQEFHVGSFHAVIT